MYSSSTLFGVLSLVALTSVSAAPAPDHPSGGGGYSSTDDYQYDYNNDGGEWSGSGDAGSYDYNNYGGDTTTVTWSTTLAAGSYATPSYGSGSKPHWNQDSCYQMCQAQYGGAWGGSAPAWSAPPSSATWSASAASPTWSGGAAAYTPPASASSPAASDGGMATHTIIVAPTQGVLRFTPFAVNAKQGDSLKFIWGAGPHSATLSDNKNVCNKSTTASAFDSGKLNATATFTTTVGNVSTPQFHYCTVGQHCNNGMFGIVNPPSTNVTNNLTALVSSSSAPPKASSTAGSGGAACNEPNCWITSWGLKNPDNQKQIDGVKNACKNVPGSWEWGNKWDWNSMIDDSLTKEMIAQNYLYTRLMISYNPKMLTPGADLGSDWKPAPALASFLSTSSNTTMPGSYGDGYGGGSPAPSSSSSAAGADASGGAITPAAGASSSAGRVGTTSTWTVAFGLIWVLIASL